MLSNTNTNHKIFQFSQNTSNNLLSIYISGNIFRLIQPSSVQLIVYSVDVHTVGSQMFTSHLTIRGTNDSLVGSIYCSV